jgi:hypothetical protein
VLKVRLDDKAPSDATVHVVGDTTWSENTLIWNNAPAIGAALDTRTSLPINSWIEWDVSAAVTTAGVYSFAISSTDDRTVLVFDSRETGNVPCLEVVYADAAPDSDTDSDGDSQTDAFEIAAGFDPYRTDDHMELYADGDTVDFAAKAGHRYIVQATENLRSDGWADIHDTGVVLADGMLSILVEGSLRKEFYRIKAIPTP